VNSAVKISDIALLVVDVVEGVCSQTEALLRQAVFNQVQVVLIINKMDRLVVELKMSEFEAFRHLNRLIENVNSTLSQILQGQLIEEADLEKFEAMEKRFHFNPSLGNVIFASAVHGYAFTVADFAKIWAPKVNLDEKTLSENLFSDSYLGGGKINPNAENKSRKSMFEQLVLTPLWEVQKCALVDRNLDKLKEFAVKLNLPAVKSKQLADAFPEFMRSWLPLSTTVIRSIARCIPAQDATEVSTGF
jgi:ribosome assembly protein 1